MKKIIATLGLVLVSCTVFAAESASRNERAFLCSAVDKMLDINSADTALDLKKCAFGRQIKSTLVTEGIRNVEGVLTFRSPGRPYYKLTCSVAYYGQAILENIVGGIELVSCQ